VNAKWQSVLCIVRQSPGYTLQSHKPGTNGKHYTIAKAGPEAVAQTIREHLNGQQTVGLYALNPATQRSKWWQLTPTTRMRWTIF